MAAFRANSVVGLLAQGGADWIAGVVYLQNLVRALHLLPADERPRLWICQGPGERAEALQELAELLPPVRRFTFRARQSFRSKVRATLRYGRPGHLPISLERLVRVTGLDVLFPVRTSVGLAFPCPWIGWIPDFQHRRLPQYFSEEENARRDRRFEELVREAPQVVVSSRDAYADLMRFFPAVGDRASPLPFVTVPIDEWYEGDPRRTAASLGLPERFLIYPSQFWMHKNHRTLFEAVRLAAREVPDVALVCTGRMHDYRNPEYAPSLLGELEADDLRGRVRCLGLLGRTMQVQLIRAAMAVVQPSLFEGWSSLLEDAQAFGKPVFLSDIPIHREQDPPRARFFDPSSAEALAALIVDAWGCLEPGPDPDVEAAARRRQQDRAVDFAHRCMNVIEKTRKSR